MLSSLSEIHVAKSLSDLIWPHGLVEATDVWRPRGFLDPKEPELCDTDEFLPPEVCDQMPSWWLAITRGARTPVWDIAAICTIPGYDRKGVLLVEAKAHSEELSKGGKQPGVEANHERIGDAIQEANSSLNGVLAGWNLTRDSHYQLSNRFAWAWKLSQLGIPVVLVYLGFLNAKEMEDQGEPFVDARQWRDCLIDHAQGIVPERAWESRLLTGQAPLIPLIRSVDLSFSVALPDTELLSLGSCPTGRA